MKFLVSVLVMGEFLTSFATADVCLSLSRSDPPITMCGSQIIQAIKMFCKDFYFNRVLDNQNGESSKILLCYAPVQKIECLDTINNQDPFQTLADKDYAKEKDSMRNFQRMLDNDRNLEVELSLAEQVTNESYSQYDQMQLLPRARFMRGEVLTDEFKAKCCTEGCTHVDFKQFC